MPCFSFLYNSCIWDSLSLLDLCVDSFLALFIQIVLLTCLHFFGDEIMYILGCLKFSHSLLGILFMFLILFSFYILHNFYSYVFNSLIFCSEISNLLIASSIFFIFDIEVFISSNSIWIFFMPPCIYLVFEHEHHLKYSYNNYCNILFCEFQHLNQF